MQRLWLAATLFIVAAPAHANFDWLGKIDMAADGLSTRDSKARLEAVRGLARFDISWTRTHLLKALSDPDTEVRRAAGRILGARGVSEAADPITAWLTDPDGATRATAAEILGRLKATQAAPALVRALGDQDDAVRVRAVTALGEIGGQAAVIPLIGRLEDEKSAVRIAAVKALVKIGDPRAVVQLVGSFDDSSIELRQQAIRAVGKLGDKAAVPALLRLLRDNTVRSAAATTLGDLAAEQAIEPLVDALTSSHSDNSYRAVVATALGHIAKARSKSPGSHRAVDALVRALADRQLRKAAREALQVAGRAAAPALIRHLRGELPGDPKTAVEILHELRDARATDALISELQRGRLDRALVLAALSATGDDKALVPIIGLLRDSDPEVRLAAMRALEPLAENDSRAADVVVDLLGDKELEIRILAAQYLGTMRARVGVQPLMKIANKKQDDFRLRTTAIHALGLIGDARGAKAALAALESSETDLHRSAATALMYIAPGDAVAPLLRLASGNGGPRLQALRALAAVVRNRPRADVRKFMLRLAKTAPSTSSLAAIDVLAAMADPASAGELRKLSRHADPTRRASALSALARVSKNPKHFEAALRSRDDRVAGAAARALQTVGVQGQEAALLRLAGGKGFAASINASAALARGLPPKSAPKLVPLLHAQNPLVRANAIFGLGRAKLKSSRERVLKMLEDDESWAVRAAAARALSRIGSATEGLKKSSIDDPHEEVRTEAKRALEVFFKANPPTEWRNFLFVDRSRYNAPLLGRGYAIVGSDGIGVAVYSDGRGQAQLESFPPGGHHIVPADRLGEL